MVTYRDGVLNGVREMMQRAHGDALLKQPSHECKGVVRVPVCIYVMMVTYCDGVLDGVRKIMQRAHGDALLDRVTRRSI